MALIHRLANVLPDVKAVTSRLAGVFLAVVFFGLSTALAQPVKVDVVEAELIANVDAVTPGQSLLLGLRLRHDKGWHTYWRNPGDSGLPTQFILTMPAGFEAGEIAWPRPSRFLIPPLANLGYDRDVLLVRRITVPPALSGSVNLQALGQWLVCREVCIPGEARLTLTLPVASQDRATGAAPAPGKNAWLFQDAARQVPTGPHPVALARSGDNLLMHVPAEIAPAGTRRIEYFAFATEKIQHAPPQQLYKLDSGWRLEVPLTAELLQRAAASDQVDAAAALAEAGAGVLVFDDNNAVAVNGAVGDQGLAAFATGGQSIGPVEGHVIPFFAKTQGAGNSLLNALRSRGDSPAQPGAGNVLAGRAGNPAQGNAGRAIAAPAATGAVVAAVPPAAAGASGQANMSLVLAAVFAVIGGLILNLMPCVFPVIGLKILGFAGSGALGASTLTAQQKTHVRSGCFWFATGVIASFVLLAAVLIGLRAAGEGVGWGFQLQSPPFVALMSLLFLVIGLNFSGLFEIGTQLTRLGQFEHQMGAQANSSAEAANGEARKKPRALSALGAGALAVLVATPCTAPFMGSALGYTLGQPAATALLVFAALGLGMALPYLALGLFPNWLRWLPRPGRWMVTLRQLLAFPMYAAAAWLTWVLGKLTGVDTILWLSLGMVVMALALWIWGRYAGPANSGRWREMAMALSVVLGGSAIAMAWPASPPAQTQANASTLQPVAGVSASAWQPWSQKSVADGLAAGRPVLVDFTASWCVTCQVNKKLVLNSDEIRAAFARHSVRLLVADWTRQDPAITAELARNGRNSVPLYLLYKPDGKAPVVLPELLTRGVVLEALGELKL